MMKCKNYGFTLVEVLAVLVILGLLATMFIPNAIKVLEDNSQKIYKIKEKELIQAAKDYSNYDDNFDIPTEGNAVYITMSQLVSGSYLNKILDSSSGNECRAFVKVTLNSVYGYNYEACLLCDGYTTDKEFCSLSNYNDL